MKNNTLKRFVSVAVALFIAVSAFATASAATYFEENGFQFSPINQFNCRIYGYTDNKTDVVVPNKLASYTVLEIADYAFLNNNGIETVSFADAKAIDAIGEFAFSGCSQLRKISIPMTLDKIGYGAFMGCTSLSDISIYSNISDIKGQTFQNCTSLTEFTVPNSVNTISDFAFAGCTSLQKITIPKNVNNISSKAFNGCDNLTIYGYLNSYAEEYASENGIEFVAIDKKITLGDVNSDGTVDVNDVTLVQLYLAGAPDIILNEDALAAADFNQDGQIDVIDVTAIQYFIASR